MERDDELDPADKQRAEELLSKIKDAVEVVFAGEMGDAFLEWLAIVARAHRSTFHASERVHCFREGKRALFYDLVQILNLTPRQLLQLSERKYIR